MDISTTGLIIFALMSAASFLFGRWVSRGWRERRRAKEQAAARAKETRQQRRARERKQRL